MKAVANIHYAITRFLLLVFLYSAVAKFVEFAEFRSELGKSPFLHPIAGFMAWAVPVLELVVAILLIVPRAQRIALYGYFYMMAAFTAYVYLMMKKAYYLPCVCMGIFDDLAWETHLVVNAVITVLVFMAILLGQGRNAKRRHALRYPLEGLNRPANQGQINKDGSITFLY